MPVKLRSDRLMNAGGRVALAAVLAVALAACAAQPKAVAPASPAAPVADSTAAPVYHVGDSQTFSDNGTELPHFVTAVEGDKVSWIDNANARWVTLRDPTIPPLSETPAGGGAEVTRSFDPPNPTVFPLASGKQVAYKVTTETAGSPPQEERDSCEVRQPDTIIVEAGTFTAWVIACQRGGASETLYYAPEIGAIVLSARDKDAKTRRLTLVDYQKAGAPRAQQAEAATKSPDAGASADETPAAAAQTAAAVPAEPAAPVAPVEPVEPVAPPALPATPVTEKPLPPPAARATAEPSAEPSGAAAAASTAAAAAPPPSGPEVAEPAVQPQMPPAPIPAAKPVAAQAPAPHPAPPRPTPTPTPRPAPPQLAALPPSPAPGPPPAAAAQGDKYVVQYVSFNSPQDASRDWTALRARLPQLLGALKPRIDTVTTVGGTRLARFTLGPFESEARAKQLCADLHAAGPDCWIRPLK